MIGADTDNPDDALIEGDVSRNDLVLLYELCAGLNVVEFGVGGTTMYLARICKSLQCFETDRGWADGIRSELCRRGLEAKVTMVPQADPDGASLPRADVYVIDGLIHLRSSWVKAAIFSRIAHFILVHDSRRASPTNDIGWLFQWPQTAWLRDVQFHFRNSNYLLITPRQKPIEFIDWHQEAGRRQFWPTEVPR